MPLDVEAHALRAALMGDGNEPGVIQAVLGHTTGTTVIKGVHVMNDLAQLIVGGVPQHKGDLMARVIREDVGREEDHSDAALRSTPGLGEVYARAVPLNLSPRERSRLRRALGAVFNHDRGVYRPSTGMASGLATHRALLGEEGFRRFQVGALLFRLLGEPGRARLRALLTTADDPVSRLLTPLLYDAPLSPRVAPEAAEPPSPFDVAVGRRLTALLAHPLSKPALLRALLLGATLLITLRALGVGCPDGRPTALATVTLDEGGAVPLRAAAAQSFKRGLIRLDERLARALATHPALIRAWGRPAASGDERVPLGQELKSLDEAAPVMLRAARTHRWVGERNVYWPEEFLAALGRKAGCIQPRTDRAGWGKRLALTGDLIEVLLLMYTEPDGPPVPWRTLWEQIAAELGLVIGVNAHRDAELLDAAGVAHVSQDALEENGEAALELAVRRGLARRLPDSDAEAGGSLT